MMSAPKRNALQIDADEFHDRKHDRKRQRDRKRDDGAGPDAEADDAHRHDDGDRLPQRLHELADRTLDDGRLIGHQRRLDADRQIGGDLVHVPLNVSAERQDVSALSHGDGEADGRLSIDPKHRLRRIDEDPPDAGNVAQSEQAAVRGDIDGQNIQFGFERAGDAKRELFITRLQDAGGH